jgi:hypothetical protein
MVFRFFKDKAPAPAAAKEVAPVVADTPATTPAVPVDPKAAPAAQADNLETTSKASLANPTAVAPDQTLEEDDATKLEKATAATKALNDFAQMASMRATAEDVIAAYKIFLGRLPESAQVVQQRMGPPVAKLLVDFLASSEFLSNPERAKLIIGLAKHLQEKQAVTPESILPSDTQSPGT